MKEVSVLYPVRDKKGSVVDNSLPAVQVGANIIYRYGIDGAAYGDSGYKVISRASLWPWSNEARIKQEMCGDSNVTRGFCATGTRLDGVDTISLTSYIWEFLGNQMPPLSSQVKAEFETIMEQKV